MNSATLLLLQASLLSSPFRVDYLRKKEDIDKIHLQLRARALNHLLEGKANQININIEDHTDDDKRKTTYLMLAATDGLLKIVKLLLEHHADVHAKR